MKRLLIDSIGRIDLIVWLLVIFFFCGSSLIFGGDIQLSFLGAAGIIFEMLIIGISIEIIIDALKQHKGIGTITGFITNGPEALCLIVGLTVGDILFAASTPLGSNFMNPVLLLTASIICGATYSIFTCKPVYTIATISLTALFASGFYFIDPQYYLWWTTGALAVTIPLFFLRPDEQHSTEEDNQTSSGKLLIPAILILIGAGYFLDSVVSFAAENSKAPKGVIGFFVLATLTSWPEFKSCLALLNRGKTLAAILNITVSNITNIWLATTGIIFYLLTV